MKKFALALVVALIMPVGSPAAGNDPITRQQADDNLRELQQIRKMLQQSPRGEGGTRAPAAAPSNITMSLENTRFIGSESAPLTIVEFTDFQCPFCQRFHLTAFKSIKEKYIDTGIVRFYSRDLPLEMHKNAFRAAQAGRCADEQGHFWEMRNLLQSNSEKLAPENLAQYAADLTLDGDQFQLCVSGEKYRASVKAEIAQANRIGAEATPTFLIGQSTPEGVVGPLMMGALPVEAFEQRLDELYAK